MDGQPYYGQEPEVAWGKDFSNTERRTIHRTDLPWGGLVSTVWLGIDYSFGLGPPLIYETMVFDATFDAFDLQRYSDRHEAAKGHKAMVEKWQKSQ